MKANIVTLPGDYIGPEIIAQAVKVLEAVAAKYGHNSILTSANSAARPSTRSACR